MPVKIKIAPSRRTRVVVQIRPPAWRKYLQY